MGIWRNLFVRERLVDGLRHGHIRHRRLSRLDVRNHLKGVLIAGLGQMDFIARPGKAALVAKMRLGVIG